MLKKAWQKPLHLAVFFESGNSAKLPVPAQKSWPCSLPTRRHEHRCEPEEMNFLGGVFHGLQGKPKPWAADASANYRMTFGFEGQDAIAVDPENYH